MSEEILFLDIKVEGLGEQVNSFINKYKSELILKGYALKDEWDLMESVGGKIIGRRKLDLGGGLEIEKKVGKKIKAKIEFRQVDEDIRIIAWPSKSKIVVSPVVIDELQKAVDKVQKKMQ